MTKQLESDVRDALERARIDHKQDSKDRRLKRGKYEPKPGVCRVCKGKVVADIKFSDGPFGMRIGGPPPQGHVSGWHCEGCQLVYKQRPPEQ